MLSSVVSSDGLGSGQSESSRCMVGLAMLMSHLLVAVHVWRLCLAEVAGEAAGVWQAWSLRHRWR